MKLVLDLVLLMVLLLDMVVLLRRWGCWMLIILVVLREVGGIKLRLVLLVRLVRIVLGMDNMAMDSKVVVGGGIPGRRLHRSRVLMDLLSSMDLRRGWWRRREGGGRRGRKWDRVGGRDMRRGRGRMGGGWKMRGRGRVEGRFGGW